MNEDDFRHAVGHAFESVTKNQRTLARGIEQLSDALSALVLSIVAHGYISEDTYETVQERIKERRKELQNEPDMHEWMAAVFKATKPSEN